MQSHSLEKGKSFCLAADWKEKGGGEGGNRRPPDLFGGSFRGEFCSHSDSGGYRRNNEPTVSLNRPGDHSVIACGGRIGMQIAGC